MHLFIFCSRFCQPAMFPLNKERLIPTPPPWTTWAGWTFLAGPLGLGYPALFVPLDQFQRPPTTWSTWLTPGWTLPAWIFPMAAMNITEKQLPIAGFEYLFLHTYFSRLGWQAWMMNIARMNFSHVSYEYHGEIIANFRFWIFVFTYFSRLGWQAWIFME